MRHVTFTLTLGLVLCAMASAGCSSTKAPTSAANQWLKPPTVPPKLNVPAGNAVIYHARATGTQIYVAKPSPDGKLAWTLKAPSADLFDEDGSKVGTHFAGPTWDIAGSKVIGQKLESIPIESSVDWLLLKAKSTEGAGVLEKVTFIQRVNTTAGKPPATMPDGTREGAESAVPYTADYYFYAPSR